MILDDKLAAIIAAEATYNADATNSADLAARNAVAQKTLEDAKTAAAAAQKAADDKLLTDAVAYDSAVDDGVAALLASKKNAVPPAVPVVIP